MDLALHFWQKLVHGRPFGNRTNRSNRPPGNNNDNEPLGKRICVAFQAEEKARELLERLINKYKQSLTYFSGIQPSIQNGIASDIITDIERYRSLLYVMKDNKDLEFYTKNKAAFNSLNKRFERLERKCRN